MLDVWSLDFSSFQIRWITALQKTAKIINVIAASSLISQDWEIIKAVCKKYWNAEKNVLVVLVFDFENPTAHNCPSDLKNFQYSLTAITFSQGYFHLLKYCPLVVLKCLHSHGIFGNKHMMENILFGWVAQWKIITLGFLKARSMVNDALCYFSS